MRTGGVVFVMAFKTITIWIHLPQPWPISVAYPGFLSRRNFFEAGRRLVIFGRFCENRIWTINVEMTIGINDKKVNNILQGSSGSRGAKRAMAPSPVKISHKEITAEGSHIDFHVSYPFPYPVPGSATAGHQNYNM